MPIYRVTKTIEFCYGHRVLGHGGQCRHLHGHNGMLEVDVEAGSLDELGMVMDFTEVRDRVKAWIDENIDHRMVLCRQDPAAPALMELGEPLYLMDENPTAENIARHVYQQIRLRGLELLEVRLWESRTSYATYRGE